MSRRSGWFLEITLDSSTLRWWSGELDITFDSETYTGLGTRWITPEEIKRSASLKSEKIELQFDSSRQTDNTDAIGALLDAKWRRRAVRLRRIAWDWGYTPDDGDVLVDEYGRIQNVSDIIVKDEQPTLSMEIESGSLAYLERRMVTRSSASQKAVFAGDKGFDLAVQLAGTSVAWRTKEKKEGTVKKTWPEGDPAPRHLIIGECVVEGSFVAHFANGQQNKYYQTIYAIADHKLTELNGIYMNGELVYNGVLSHGVKTEVTKWRSGGARCWVTYYDGRDDQTADSYLVSAETNWTTDHRLRGLAYCIIEHLYDDDNPLDYNYGFRVKGAALYDRRLDTTAGGVGSQRWNDPDTWTYTANAMVAIDHYRMGRIVVSGSDQMWFGIGEAADNIPYAEFEELADLCDEDVILSGGGTHKRYEVNGQIPSDKSHKDVFEMLAAQMAAEAIDQGGRLSIRPPVTRSSVITLTDDDLLYESESEANPGGRIDDMVNTLVGKFRDAQNDYKFNEYPKVTNSTYVEDDNGEISDSFDLDLETDAERAQRLATLKIGLSRRIFELEETYIAKARVIAPGEWFTRTSASRGFTGKLFIADEVIRHFDGSVTVRSVEVDPDDLVWDKNNAASIDVPPAFPSISLPGLDAPTVSVTAFEESGNGAAYPAFLFEFTQPADLTDILADYYEVEYGESASGGGISGTVKRQLIDAQIDAIEAVGFLPSTEYAFRFRARLGSRIGDWGSWIYETSTANSTSTDAGEVSWSNVTDDGGKPDDNADVTSANTAAGFAGQDWGATASESEASNAEIAFGQNVLTNTQFYSGTLGWIFGNATGLTETDTVGTFAGGKFIRRSWSGTPSSNVQCNFTQAVGFPVVAGARTEFSVYAAGSAGTTAKLTATYRNQSGAIIGYAGTVAQSIEGNFDDGVTNAVRLTGFMTAPSGAATVDFVVPCYPGTNADPVIEIALPFMSPARSGQTEFSDWSPGFEAVKGADITGDNVSSGFTGQGALATEDALAYGSGFLTNFGAMAGNNFASFGVNVRLEDGTTVVTDNAVVTSSGVASGFSGQTAWATFSASTDRVQYLSDAGLLDSLSRISTRPLSLLSGRTADYITYTGGATVDSLEPAEAGSDVTGSNVSSGFTGQDWGATASETEASNAEIAFGQNVLTNTEFSSGTTGWALANSAGITETDTVETFAAGRFVRRSWSGTPASNSQCNFAQALGFPVSAGERIELSAYLAGSTGTTARLTATFRDSAGIVTAYANGTTQAIEGDFDDGVANAVRLTVFGTAPANTAKVDFVIPCFTGTNANPIIEIALPFMSPARADQTEFSAWVPGFEATKGADITSANVSSGFTGQGALATEDDLTLGGGYLLGFGDLAANNFASFGVDVRLEDGTTLATDSALVTASGVASGFAGQTAWATFSASTSRVQYLSDSGLLDSLTRVSSRPLSALSGRTADQITYTSAGATVDSLEPQEAGANITEDRVASGFSGQDWGATASEAEASNSEIGQGANALRNTEFRITAGYWYQQGSASGISTSYGASASGLRRAVLTAPSVANNQNVVLTGGGKNVMPVKPGDRVELSAHIAAAGFTSGQVLAFWYKSSGGFLSASTVASGDLTGYDGANGLDDYVRIGGFVTAPAGTGACVISLRATNTSGATLTDPVAYFAQPLARVADAVQAQLSPYTPGFEAELAADVTEDNVSSGFTGQGALATEDDIALDSGFLTGLLPTNRAASGLINTNISIASNGALSGGGGGQVTFGGLGGGDVGVLDSISLGSTYLRREDGTTQLTDNLVVTSVGTASGFSGQGALATLNALAYGDAELTGFGSLATLTQIALGSTYIKREDGTTTVTDTLVITTLGVSSGFSGQGDLATANMTYGGSAPSSPSNGDFWADTAEGALKFRNAGTWETIADISPTGAFSASYSGDPVNDSGTATDFTTSSISINTSGGTGPYLYLTEIISANVLVPKTSVTLPNSSSFQLSAEGFSVSENEKGIIRTTVVDETTGNSATIIKPWSMTRTS